MADEYTGTDSFGSPSYGDTTGTTSDSSGTPVSYFDPGTGTYTDGKGYPVTQEGVPLEGNPNYVAPAASTGTGTGTGTAASASDPATDTTGILSKISGLTGADLQKWITANPALAAAGLGLAAKATGLSSITPTGWQGVIPSLSAVRSQINYNDTNRVPGSSGRDYFTPTQFVAKGAAPAAQAASDTQAQGLAAAAPVAAPQTNPYAGKFATPWAKQDTKHMAHGGLAHGRYLQGTTDGMADKINTSIDNKQPAKLSHGEFVVPADVVSHLGNGNSDAGAQRLYAMMDKVREARTGTKKQGKEIDPNKFMPGGLAGTSAEPSNYASGGAVAFNTGGVLKFDGTTNGSAVPAASSGTTGSTGYGNTASSTLSPWAGDYVSGMLGQGQALANAPYQQYQGPLTAGPSDLQQQQAAGLSQVAQTGLTPTQYNTSTFDAAQANKYMNPYLQASLDPQLAELQRTAQINNVADASKLTGAGAFGGGRQAVLMGEQNRNLLDKTNQLVSQGYNTAYNNATNQFNADQNRGLQTQQAQQAANETSANFGLKTLEDLGAAGATQQATTQAGLTADQTAFNAQRDNPYKMVQFEQGLLQGLPISTQTTTPNQTGISSAATGTSDMLALLKSLGYITDPATTTPAAPK